jgi:hypothetical protein
MQQQHSIQQPSQSAASGLGLQLQMFSTCSDLYSTAGTLKRATSKINSYMRTTMTQGSSKIGVYYWLGIQEDVDEKLRIFVCVIAGEPT